MNSHLVRLAVLVVAAFSIETSVAQMNCTESKFGVVKVEGSESGTGLVVARHGDTVYILTAYHLAGDRMTVEFPESTRPLHAALFRYQQELDLAVITAVYTGKIASFFSRTGLRLGERASMIGHPTGLDWECYVNAAIVSRLDYQNDSRNFLFTNIVIQKGLSGGPVFDEDGNLIGIVTGRGPSGNGIAVKLDAALFDPDWAFGINNVSKTSRPNEARRGADLQRGFSDQVNELRDLIKENVSALAAMGFGSGADQSLERSTACKLVFGELPFAPVYRAQPGTHAMNKVTVDLSQFDVGVTLRRIPVGSKMPGWSNTLEGWSVLFAAAGGIKKEFLTGMPPDSLRSYTINFAHQEAARSALAAVNEMIRLCR